MKTPLRLVPLLLLAAAGDFGMACAAEDEALPPIFVPRSERRPAVSLPVSAAPRPMAGGVSELMRARLREKIAALPSMPVATPLTASSARPDADAVLMEKMVVQAARLPKWAPRRDEPALWHALKTGVLYEKVDAHGTQAQLWFNILPFTTGGIQPRESTRFGLGFTLKW